MVSAEAKTKAPRTLADCDAETVHKLNELVDPNAVQTVLVCACGNVLEWFDFGLFGTLAGEINANFFPPGASDLGVFAVFAGAFLMRPLGGLFFGYLSIKTSPQKSLAISMVMMAAATTLTGALPTYEMAGSWATALVAILRALQGFSAGGQLIGAYIVCLDACSRRRRGMISGTIMAGAAAGILLAGLVCEVVRVSISPEQMTSWGWRIPFFFSVLAAPASYYLESKVAKEEEEELEAETIAAKLSCRELVMGHLGAHWVNFWCVSTWTCFFFALCTWLLNFEALELGPLNVSSEYAYNIAVMFLCFVGLLVAGAAADAWQGERVFTLGTILLSISIVPLFYGLKEGSDLGIGILFLQLIWAIFVVLPGSVLGLIGTSLYPRSIRFVGMGFSYNLAQCLFGGPTPLILSALSKRDDAMPAAYFLCAVGVVSLIFSTLGFYIPCSRVKVYGDELMPRELQWIAAKRAGSVDDVGSEEKPVVAGEVELEGLLNEMA